jgi:uncharacterized protein YecT (DUF1311 family)
MTVLVAALVTWSPHTQYSEQYRICNQQAMTQSAMHTCASEEAARVDVELNNVYQTLLKRSSSRPGAIQKMKRAERTWVTYRDAYIEAMYPAPDKQAAYGSIYPTELNLLRADLTRDHIRDLRRLLEQHTR